MNMKPFITLSITLVMVVLLGAGHANAETSGIDRKMRQHLNTLVAAQGPYIEEGRRRTYVSLGNMSVRHDVMPTMRLWDYQKPDYSGGCGGIDMFAGSFSFLKAEQIVQMLRSLASAIPSIAFELALDWISEKLSAKIGNKLDWLKELNWDMINGCKMRSVFKANQNADKTVNFQSAFTDLQNEFFEKVKSESSSDGVAAGSANGRTQNAAAVTVQVFDQWTGFKAGNVTWIALTNGEIFSTGMMKQFKEQFVSALGTYVFCLAEKGGEAKCIDNQEVPTDEVARDKLAPVEKRYGGDLSLDSLVYGGTTEMPVVNGVKRCESTAGATEVQCLHMIPDTISNYAGIKRELLRVFAGVQSGEDTSTAKTVGKGGILHNASRSQRWDVAPTQEELSYISFMGDRGRRIVDLAGKDEAAARRLFHDVVDVVAYEMTYEFLYVTSQKVKGELAKNSHLPKTGEAIKFINENLETRRREMEKFMQSRSASRSVEEMFESVEKSIDLKKS